MAKGFFGKHSQETKDRISRVLKEKGIRPPRWACEKSWELKRGTHLSEETKKKISLGNTGKKRTPEVLIVMREIGKKRRATEKTKSKMSATQLKRWANGFKFSKEAIEKMIKANSGVNNHSWKGGVTPFLIALRGQGVYRKWRIEVFKRDRFQCVLCGYKSKGKRIPDIQADHIRPFTTIIAEHNITNLEQAMQCPNLWLIENGRTLCVPCHRNTDTWGGHTTYMNRHLSSKV